MSISLSARIVKLYFRLRKKQSYEKTAEILKRRLAEGKERKAVAPKRLRAKKEENENGGIFYINEEKSANNAIIYIHGGAYCTDFYPQHFDFIKKLADKFDAAVIVPAYRLAPFATYKEAFDLIVPLYRRVVKKYEKVVLMGDSAGGGLAVSLSEYFYREGLKLPDETILLSPWVDVSLENPEIPLYIDRDPWLTLGRPKASIEYWKGDLDEKDYRLSALYGDYKKLNHVTVFLGTEEILYPDVIAFFDGLEKDGSNELIIGEGLYHDYPLCPIKEAKEAFKIITEKINRAFRPSR